MGQSQTNLVFQGVSGIYLLLLCDVINRLGFNEQDIIGDMGISRDELLKPDSRITMKMGHVAAQRGTALAGDMGLGMAYAQALKVTLHGSVGLVALTSPTIGDALKAMARFLALRAPFFKAEFNATEQDMVVTLIPTMNMDGPIQTFMSEAILIGAAIVAEQLLGQPLQGARVEMTGPEPNYYARYRQQLPLPVQYKANACSLCLPLALHDSIPQLADPVAAELARKQCEAEYQKLFPQQEKFCEKIARHLNLSAKGAALPGQEDVARRFHISVRTLKRRLQEDGVSFRDLLETELKQRAQDLLNNTDQDVSEIAYQLGYRDVGNFSTAFKRWCGVTPTEFRKQAH